MALTGDRHRYLTSRRPTLQLTQRLALLLGCVDLLGQGVLEAEVTFE